MSDAKEQADAALNRAIDGTDAKILRELLKSMCQKSEENRSVVKDHLLAVVPQKRRTVMSDWSDEEEEEEEEEEDEEDEDEETEREWVESRKRRKKENKRNGNGRLTESWTIEETSIQRFEKCSACKATYDVTRNHDGVCHCHPGRSR
ncbi:hypothetical protein F5Y17DRAFT_249127 [Xylariaceae sp. FL0594]|nr:hypothetical protein F5Y17DRAFT_249127 [Xylariaceae sp. FL0594]